MTPGDRSELYGVLRERAERIHRARAMGAVGAAKRRDCKGGVPAHVRGGVAVTSEIICPGERGYESARSAFLLRPKLRVAMQGMGDAGSDLRAMPLPGPLARYLATGAPMGTIRRDLGAATAQIPRFVYGIGAALAVLMAAGSYRKWRDTPRAATDREGR